MKKIIALILSLCVVLSLCACGTSESSGNGGSNSNDIELTLDNYSTYLEVSGAVSGGGQLIAMSDGLTGHDELIGTVTVNGVSTNYNYNDVVVTVKMSGTYGQYKNWDRNGTGKFDNFEISCECNIAGDGENSESIDIGEYDCGGGTVESCEVIEISGTVTPVK